MIRIAPDLLKKRNRECDGLLHEKALGSVQPEKRWQLLSRLLAQNGNGLGPAEKLMYRVQNTVEQRPMTPLVDNPFEDCPCERRKVDGLKLRHDPTGDEGRQAGLLARVHRCRQQTQNETRQIRATRAVRQPIGCKRGEIDLAQLFVYGIRGEEVCLYELSQFVGDTISVVRHDGSMRYRQAKRFPEERDDRVPVREPPDRSRFGESGNEAECRMSAGKISRHQEQRERTGKNEGGNDFDTPKLASRIFLL